MAFRKSSHAYGPPEQTAPFGRGSENSAGQSRDRRER